MLPPQQQRPRRTQWAAQFAVASELCKRGYEVSFTMGNHTPFADLMVVSPQRSMFLVDVKGLYKKNPWIVKCSEIEKLYFAFAFVPDAGPNQYFIATQTEVNKLIRQELRRLNRPDNYPATGIAWNLLLDQENRWDVLPG